VERFKTEDASSYDAVAESFGYFTELVTRPLADIMVARANPGTEGQILDVGTGSGVVALAAAARLGGRGSVTGVDLSDGLLRQARRNIAAAGLDQRIKLERADAEALPFAAQTFDAVLCLFALLHFPRPEMALAEMYRVLKPGGKLIIAIGSGPPLVSLRAWIHRLSRVPDLLRLRTGKLLLAPSHLDRLVDLHIPKTANEETQLAQNRGGRAAMAEKLVRAAGFAQMRTHWQARHLTLPTAEEFWDLQRTFSSIARKRLRGATPDQAAKVSRQFEAECRRVLENRGRLVYHYAAFYVEGTKPA
jgi:ubiquinone/menaquinone biosynthesis C-methylase UbiE